jgi:glycerol-3-phosphate acyltransferase PlsY
MIIAGLCSILGHNYTCWLRFRGGKGIATSAGVVIGLVPVAFSIILGVWIITALLTRYVSLASIASAVALPIAVWALGREGILISVSIFMSTVAIYKHRGNIQRLMNGTEHRFGADKNENALKTTK